MTAIDQTSDVDRPSAPTTYPFMQRQPCILGHSVQINIPMVGSVSLRILKPSRTHSQSMMECTILTAGKGKAFY